MAGRPVFLTVPADARYLRIVRTVASSAAAAGGLDLDRIEDLGLAIDEAATALIRTTTGAVLESALINGPDGIQVHLEVDGAEAAPWPPDGWADSLGARVLEAVARDVDFGSPGTRRTVHLVVG